MESARALSKSFGGVGRGANARNKRATSVLGGRIFGSREYARKNFLFAILHGDVTRDQPIKVSTKIRWRNMDPRPGFCPPVYPAVGLKQALDSSALN